jgi:undecaprenyl-diphosphatase
MLGRAVALGIVQGPTELLPVSSSAHLRMLPALLGWDERETDPELQKSLEIALHAGTAAALLWTERALIAEELRSLGPRNISVLVASFVPAAIAGLAFERTIEARLGGRRSTAFGLIAGSVAMVLADRRPQLRSHGEARWRDGLALGLGQAAALAPGVSRNGATLVAARSRRFTRRRANRLSRTVALPVIAGAVALKGVRLHRRGIAAQTGRALAAGAVAAAASTLASRRLIDVVERDSALWPYAVYRCAFAATILRGQTP